MARSPTFDESDIPLDERAHEPGEGHTDNGTAHTHDQRGGGWRLQNSMRNVADAWHANAATSGLVWDLTIAAITLTIWILTESIPRRDWRSLLAVPAIYCIGVSCGLPLYLFLRSRPRHR